jgi:hypothetical protein
MDFSDEDIKIITNALIKASNATETEWLNIDKAILESYKFGTNETLDSNVRRMWEQLYKKVVDTMKRTKAPEDANG